MKVIQSFLGLVMLSLIGLMIKVGIEICNREIATKKGFILLILYGLLVIGIQSVTKKAPKVVGHLLGHKTK